jgi:hypothetical protein
MYYVNYFNLEVTNMLRNKYIIALMFAAIGIVSTHFLGDDNIIEECSEEIIKEETGLDLDLTPRSKEK